MNVRRTLTASAKRRGSLLLRCSALALASCGGIVGGNADAGPGTMVGEASEDATMTGPDAESGRDARASRDGARSDAERDGGRAVDADGDSGPCGADTGGVVTDAGAPCSVLLPGVPWSEVGENPLAIATGDFDRDGRLDFIVATERTWTVSYSYGYHYTNESDPFVGVVLGKGDGTFRRVVDYETNAGATPVAITVGDFNGDCAPDFALASDSESFYGGYYYGSSQGGLTVFLGRGDGTFMPPVQYTAVKEPWAIVSADFDGDGALDLAAAAIDGSTAAVYVLRGNGDGTFGAAAAFPVPGAVSRLAVGDFNGDLAPDLAISLGASDEVGILIGKGDGTFAPPRTFAGGVEPIPIAVGDFDGDGSPDVVVVSGTASELNLLLGAGDGTFRAPIRTPLASATVEASAVRVADLDGDGHLDVAVTETQTGAVALLLGNGDATFHAPTVYGAGRYSTDMVLADFDRDGKVDVAVTNSLTGDVASVGVFLGKGDGTVVAPATYAAGFGVASADLDGDGVVDLAVGTASGVDVRLGVGDGTFAAATSFAVGAQPTFIIAADLDGDGAVNLATTAATGSLVSVLLGNGDGTFATAATYRALASATSLATADLDGDGAPDLMVSSPDKTSVAVLLGEGDGTFGVAQTFPLGSSPGGQVWSVATGDFDGDGNLDVVASDGLLVRVFLGKGDGTFDAGVSIRSVHGPLDPSGGSIQAVDMDGDGKLDVALIGEYSAGLLLGRGNGTFDRELVYAGAGSTLTIADFDGDGRLDVATDGVAVLLNRSVCAP